MSKPMSDERLADLDSYADADLPDSHERDRVKELIREVERQKAQESVFQTSLDRETDGHGSALLRALKAEADNAALHKRVAELERRMKHGYVIKMPNGSLGIAIETAHGNNFSILPVGSSIVELTRELERQKARAEKAEAKNKPLEQSVFEMKAWVAELQDCLKKAEAENDELSKRAGEAEKLSVRLYSQGYGRGHDDTVEGVYIDVLPCDEETYFRDEVLCITREAADAARKGKE